MHAGKCFHNFGSLFFKCYILYIVILINCLNNCLIYFSIRFHVRHILPLHNPNSRGRRFTNRQAHQRNSLASSSTADSVSIVNDNEFHDRSNSSSSSLLLANSSESFQSMDTDNTVIDIEAANPIPQTENSIDLFRLDSDTSTTIPMAPLPSHNELSIDSSTGTNNLNLTSSSDSSSSTSESENGAVDNANETDSSNSTGQGNR